MKAIITKVIHTMDYTKLLCQKYAQFGIIILRRSNLSALSQHPQLEFLGQLLQYNNLKSRENLQTVLMISLTISSHFMSDRIY